MSTETTDLDLPTQALFKHLEELSDTLPKAILMLGALPQALHELAASLQGDVSKTSQLEALLDTIRLINHSLVSMRKVQEISETMLKNQEMVKNPSSTESNPELVSVKQFIKSISQIAQMIKESVED